MCYIQPTRSYGHCACIVLRVCLLRIIVYALCAKWSVPSDSQGCTVSVSQYTIIYRGVNWKIVFISVFPINFH